MKASKVSKKQTAMLPTMEAFKISSNNKYTKFGIKVSGVQVAYCNKYRTNNSPYFLNYNGNQFVCKSKEEVEKHITRDFC